MQVNKTRSGMKNLKDTRCITTGLNNNKVSTLLEERVVSEFIPYELFPSFRIQELFYTEDFPQSLFTRHLKKIYDIDLPQNAIRFLKLRMPTKSEMTKNLLDEGQPIPEDWTKFNLHRTDTVDYVYVLSGKITSITGNEHIELDEGNFLAQVGTEHTWINNHNDPCILLCIIVGIASSGEKKKMIVE